MSKRILIIDDEPDIRLYLQAALEDQGYSVTALESGEALVETVRRERPDVLCLDVMMPGHSGISLYRRLVTTPDLPRPKVIFVTGMAPTVNFDLEIFQQLRRDGLPLPDGLVEKPVRIPELLEKLADVLRVSETTEAP